MENINYEVFYDQLHLTQRWTQYLSKDFDITKGSFGEIFRQTNPIIGGQNLYSFELGGAMWNIDNNNISLYKEALAQAVSVRDSANYIPFDGDGRILVSRIACSFHDGVATFESNCFMDESDVPPIDTWFYLLENATHFNGDSILFCWIPRQFEKIVEQTMEVELMIPSYFWIDEIFPGFKGEDEIK